jgi:cytochrome c oxidase subunit III
MERRIIDVSGLPPVPTKIHHDPLFYGVMSLMAIEGTMFALLGATYFYFRGNEQQWPPTGVIQPSIWITTTTVLLLLSSCIPMLWVFRKAPEERLRPLQIGMVLSVAANLAILWARYLEIAHTHYRWNSHAYGSIVWGVLTMHTLHLLTGTGENVMLMALLFKGPVEKKHMTDLRLNVIYWVFVVVSWIPFYAMIYLDSSFFRNSL